MSVLSSIRQGTLHGVRSKMSQIGRCKQYILGRLKKGVSVKQDDRKKAVLNVHTKAVLQRSKDDT